MWKLSKPFGVTLQLYKERRSKTIKVARGTSPATATTAEAVVAEEIFEEISEEVVVVEEDAKNAMPRETREPPKRAATDLSTGPSGPDIAEPERPSFWSQLWFAIRHFCKRANNSKVNFAGGEIFSTPYLKFLH